MNSDIRRPFDVGNQKAGDRLDALGIGPPPAARTYDKDSRFRQELTRSIPYDRRRRADDGSRLRRRERPTIP